MIYTRSILRNQAHTDPWFKNGYTKPAIESIRAIKIAKIFPTIFGKFFKVINNPIRISGSRVVLELIFDTGDVTSIIDATMWAW